MVKVIQALLDFEHIEKLAANFRLLQCTQKPGTHRTGPGPHEKASADQD